MEETQLSALGWWGGVKQRKAVWAAFDRIGREAEAIKVIRSPARLGQLFPLPTNSRQAAVRIRPSIQSRHTPAVPSPGLTA